MRRGEWRYEESGGSGGLYTLLMRLNVLDSDALEQTRRGVKSLE